MIRFPATALLLAGLGLPVSAAGVCPLTGPNLLQDTDFAIEAQNPQSTHWKRARHAGENNYQVDIANGELTITKTGPQDWFSYSQRVPLAELRGVKVAFTAELKFDMTPTAGMSSAMSNGGLDIAVRSGMGNIIWTSQRNHQPRLGKTDWQTVQVVFAIPRRAKVADLRFTHAADGTLQVRNPSFRRVDETGQSCPVTPDRPSSKAKEEPPLR